MKKYRTSDKIMSRKIAREEARIVKEYATPRYKYFKIGKLSIHFDKRRNKSLFIEGKFYPENAGKTHPPQVRIMLIGKHGFIKQIKLRRF